MNAALALLLSLFCLPALAQSSPDAVFAAVEKRVESEMRASASPFMHAMRARDETVESSRLKINLWIRYNFQKAFDFKSKGDTEGALFHYLMARHTLRDATSPTANDAEGNPAILDGPLEHHELRVHGWRDKVDQDMQSMFDTNRVPPGDLLKMYGIDSASGPIDRPGQLPRPDLRSATRRDPRAGEEARRAAQAWIESIRTKVHANLAVPEGTPSGAEAAFDVTQSRSGEVLSVKLASSSGFKPYDEAAERAIWNSSPLPGAPRPEVFWQRLELRLRP